MLPTTSSAASKTPKPRASLVFLPLPMPRPCDSKLEPGSRACPPAAAPELRDHGLPPSGNGGRARRAGRAPQRKRRMHSSADYTKRGPWTKKRRDAWLRPSLVSSARAATSGRRRPKAVAEREETPAAVVAPVGIDPQDRQQELQTPPMRSPRRLPRTMRTPMHGLSLARSGDRACDEPATAVGKSGRRRAVFV